MSIEIKPVLHFEYAAGEGRQFVLLHTAEQDQTLIDRTKEIILEGYRLSIFAYQPALGAVVEGSWLQASGELQNWLAAQDVKQVSLLGLGRACEVLIDYCLRHARAVRSMILLDAVRGGLPWALLHRIRCPVLLLEREENNSTVKRALEQLALKLPTSWRVSLRAEEEAFQFSSVLGEFLSVPARCPQKRGGTNKG
jgi:hypothetical protein